MAKTWLYAVLCYSGLLWGQEPVDPVSAEFEHFRAEMEQASPGELFELQGEQLWQAVRGPKQVSLARSCDLGLGLGVVQGAYAAMPRYFADAGRVMDAERRIVWCMVEKQGFAWSSLSQRPFASGSYTPDATYLVSYVAAQSRHYPFAVPMHDPAVKAAFDLGQALASYRAGPYDFACHTCHGQSGRRIRLQVLPNLHTPEGALKAVQGWPGYRMTGARMLTQQWRINDCFRQQRFPEPAYASDAVTALLTYLTGQANGQLYTGPGIKR